MSEKVREQVSRMSETRRTHSSMSNETERSVRRITMMRAQEDTEEETAMEQEKESLKLMARHLEKHRWPQRELFETFDKFVGGLECGATHFRQRQYPEDEIADALHNHIMTTPLAGKYVQCTHTEKQ